jgi:hypothetical protein
LPTVNQMRQVVIICQYLSNFCQPIYLFRYDVDREEIFIIAGELESIEITIFSDGTWRYEIVEL